jgi:hypothetical protein
VATESKESKQEYFIERVFKAVSMLFYTVEFLLAVFTLGAFVYHLNTLKDNLPLQNLVQCRSEIYFLLLITSLWGVILLMFSHSLSQFIINKYHPKACLSVHRPRIHQIFLVAQALAELAGPSLVIWMQLNNAHTPLTLLIDQFGYSVFKVTYLFAVLVGYPLIVVVGFCKLVDYVWLAIALVIRRTHKQ